MAIQKESLEDQIRSAFEAVEYPGDECLVSENYGEYLDVRRDFRQRHWKAITERMLERNSSSLAFMTTEAFRFYLPAYLIYSLSEKGNNSVVVDTTVSALCPRDNPLFWPRLAALSVKQRHAVQTFLEFVKTQEPDNVLLEEALEVFRNAD
jgi:hypothetical protein